MAKQQQARQEIKQESLYLDDDGHQLHLRHIYGDQLGTPVLMLHGTVENGKIFYTDSGKGLACFLAEQGFNVFVADFRGRGKSVPNVAERNDHGQLESIQRDIPAFLKFVFAKTNQPAHLVCHSWGGVLLASCLARYPENLDYVRSKICFGTKRTISVKSVEKWFKLDLFWHWLAPKLSKKTGYFDAVSKKLGADNETRISVQDISAWVKQGQWRDRIDDFDYQQAAQSITWPPTWHITGVNDKLMGHQRDVKHFIEETNNQAAKFSLLSKSAGNHFDYDHINILTHPKARDDHFPELIKWLKNYEEARSD